MTDAAGTGPGLSRSPDGAGGTGGRSAGFARARFWVTALTVALAAGAPLVMLAGPVTWRLGLLPLHTAMWGVAAIAQASAALGGLMAITAIGLHLLAPPRRGVIIGIAVLVLSLRIGFGIYAMELQRESLPPVWDAQTDWSAPVPLSPGQLAARGADAAVADDAARVPQERGKWSGMTFADAQADAFDLKPLVVNVSVAEATARVAEEARRRGWTDVVPDPVAGRVEGVFESLWYGLKSDLAVRITPEGAGARIDARSVSRTPQPDMGANARRVEILMGDVQFSLRATEER
jgi:fatty-acyl-CoA synthase